MGSNQQVLDKFASGEITAETPAYKKICNLITYCKSNAESRQLIGLCILLAGALNLARKENRFPRIFIEHPETHLHPKMECKLMTLLEQIKKDYGRPADEPALEEEP
jgi:predicted ATP-dependent endonuclease of OLD family